MHLYNTCLRFKTLIIMAISKDSMIIALDLFLKNTITLTIRCLLFLIQVLYMF